MTTMEALIRHQRNRGDLNDIMYVSIVSTAERVTEAELTRSRDKSALIALRTLICIISPSLDEGVVNSMNYDE